MSTTLIILLTLTFICYNIYFFTNASKKVPAQRKQKIFELLKTKHIGLKENNLGFFECVVNDKNILFEYKTIQHKNGFSNILNVYLDISAIEDDIKKLCKIHFYCTEIDNKDWVEMPVDILFDSVNNLAKHSQKTVSKIISETENYISEKRRQRDKK